ncbi:MAG: hypothetical protein RH942_19130 [Kiloniellaceae bacterium]
MGVRKPRFSAIKATALASGLASGLASALAAGTLASPSAEAIIAATSSTPDRTSIAATDAASVTVNWKVQRTTIDPPKPGTVSSDSLRVLIGGSLVATLPRSLSRSVTGDEQIELLQIREVVRIPSALVYRAVKQGSSLKLTRRFVDSVDDTFEVASHEVTPSGPGTAAVAVQRLALTFDDGTRTRVLQKDGELRVIAELNTTGVGLVAGIWEVASSTAVGDAPIYRPLTLVRQGVAGNGRSVITSPQLPTGEEGTAYVRFRVTEPRPADATPTLQYYVTAKRPAAAAGTAREFLLTGPRTGQVLDRDTRFSWTQLEGTKTYQLLFHALPAGPAAPLDPQRDTQAAPGMAREGMAADAVPITGIFVPEGLAEAFVDAATLAQLPSRRSYLWQVVAFDANGAVIGSSSMREIYKP